MPLIAWPRPLRWYGRVVRDGVADTDEERLAHLARLEALYTASRHQPLEVLYRDLSILDAKAASLLTYNSIILAAVSIFLATSARLWLRAAFAVALVVAALSCLQCLRVIWIHWSSPSSLERPEAFWLELIGIRDRRTVGYRRAWILAAVALCLVAVGGVLTLFE